MDELNLQLIERVARHGGLKDVVVSLCQRMFIEEGGFLNRDLIRKVNEGKTLHVVISGGRYPMAKLLTRNGYIIFN